MSEFHVEVVAIGAVRKHPDADTLSITNIYGDSQGEGGYPVIFRTGEFNEGDKAVYVPVDCVVPDTAYWNFLAPQPKVKDGVEVDPGYPVGTVPASYRRIKARRLRGIFSMGILAPIELLSDDHVVGTNVVDEMGITRWEPKDPSDDSSPRHPAGHNVPGPSGWVFPKYTDIEPMRKYRSVFDPNEEVVCTEKIHGMNGRWCHDGDKLWVGSHERVKRSGGDDAWCKVAEQHALDERLRMLPMHVVFGEVYGLGSQDMTYFRAGLDLVVFDIARVSLDGRPATYLDYDVMVETARERGLSIAPVLYRGPAGDIPSDLQEGMTVLGLGSHVREGYVCRPVRERYDHRIGRVVLKMVGSDYHLRKHDPAVKAKNETDRAARKAIRDAARAAV